MRSWLPFTVLVALAGCDLYFGNGDVPPCAYVGEEKEPGVLFRDPTNATCISLGGGGGCDDGCGPCPEPAGGADIGMGLCESACTDLSETSCLATAGCYAAYYNDSENDGPPSFGGCWQTAPSGPVGGSCEKLGAYECSRHDNCSLHYYSAYDTATSYGATFARCAAEAPVYPGCAGSDCAPGYHCEEQCYGSDDPGTMSTCQGVCVADNSCLAALCAPGTVCVERCDYENGVLVCRPDCIDTGHDPGSCTGQVACDALPPACPSGTTAGRSNGCWTGYCIPNSACGPGDPGECDGPVNCFANPPACPSGTTPGIAEGCWSGYCIPNGSCPAPACETLATEASCDARSDCTSVYTGTNCTCYPSGCTCETLTWNRCESVYMPL